MKITRIEWVPVRYEYEVDAKNVDEAISIMNQLDEGNLSNEEALKIIDSRSVIKTNDDFEAISEIDEEPFWEVDGKLVEDIENV